MTTRSKKPKRKSPANGGKTTMHPAMPANEKKLSVVGIGASAGGLEALQQFFQAMPPDSGLTFVVVVHLSPEHQSHLAEILAGSTLMPTEQVQDTLKLEGDHIYVIPPDRQLEITDTSVGARPFGEPRGHRNPIDTFLRSLAAWHSDGFAVILSGGGSDGTMGIRATKDAGGLVLVQDPTEAAHASMPRAAIASGMVDFVLPVRELALQLVELAHNKYHISKESLVPEKLQPEDKAVLARILGHVHTRTGHDFSKYKQTTVLRRMGRRMQVNHLETLSAYFKFLQKNAEEAQALFDDLLISVTSFFRDPEAFDVLKEKIIPKLFEDKPPGNAIRVWIPGCATGEEAYSIAMLLLEENERRDERRQILVFATDLDEGALATAREGCYSLSMEEHVSTERLHHFFLRESGYYRVHKELRDSVLFATHNLLRDPPFSRIDLVSCRNLMIYLDRDLQDQAFALLRYSVRNGGFLFIGSSENAEGPYFRALDKQHRIYTTRETSERLPELPDLYPNRLRTSQPSGQIRTPVGENSHAPALHHKLLEELAPPSILVNERRNALHLSETVGRFLHPRGGPLSQDVTELVRVELQFELRAALSRAFEQGESTLSPFIRVGFNGHARQIALLVQPRQAAKDEERMALVVFIEGGATKADATERDETADDATEVRQLREELQQIQERLRQARKEQESAQEEYRSANEEMQSINEEYRSTAEELETSKEELQSINEELETVNNELKAKFDEISLAHGDLVNLMAATDIGTLFLDAKLCIRRFTPRLSEFFSVTPADMGRPIGDFTTTLDYTTLEQDTRQVLAELAPIEREAKSLRDSKIYLARLRPYRTLKNRIDGVVITFLDITEQKKAENILRARGVELVDSESKLNLQATELLATDRHKTDFLAMLGHELRNPLAAIRNSINLLSTVQSDDISRERYHEVANRALSILERQASLMTRLVNDLLDIARINENKIELRREPVDLAGTIESAAAALRPEMEAKQLKFTVRLPAEPLYLHADSERLLQILDNLLSNAVKFTNTGGKIEVTATQENENAVIRIKDTGIGISPDKIDKIFDQFTQGRAPNQAGLGLGLSLVKNMVVMHGGTIKASSEGLGKGSKFVLRMPLSETTPAAHALAGDTGKAAVNTLRMLIIDDSPDVADVLAMLLSTENHEVEVAYDSETAYAIADRLQPQVALVDLSMPGTDGFQLAQHLRQKFPSMLLIAISGHAEDEHSREAGFDHHLLKPVSLPMINKVLASSVRIDSVMHDKQVQPSHTTS